MLTREAERLTGRPSGQQSNRTFDHQLPVDLGHVLLVNRTRYAMPRASRVQSQGRTAVLVEFVKAVWWHSSCAQPERKPATAGKELNVNGAPVFDPQDPVGTRRRDQAENRAPSVGSRESLLRLRRKDRQDERTRQPSVSFSWVPVSGQRGHREFTLRVDAFGGQVIADEASNEGALLEPPLGTVGLKALELVRGEEHGYLGTSLFQGFLASRFGTSHPYSSGSADKSRRIRTNRHISGFYARPEDPADHTLVMEGR